jgi:hypothetical protein
MGNANYRQSEWRCICLGPITDSFLGAGDASFNRRVRLIQRPVLETKCILLVFALEEFVRRMLGAACPAKQSKPRKIVAAMFF